MPQSLTLENGAKVAKTLEREGWTLPWEVQSYAEDAERARTGGYFDLSDWAMVSAAGPDARDYLNRMTTVNFKTLGAGKAAHGAFLTGKAHVVALGWFIVENDRFEFWITPSQLAPALEHIEKFHFAENFKTEDQSANFALFGVYGKAVLNKLGLPSKPLELTQAGLEGMGLTTWGDETIRDLTWLRVRRADASVFLKALNAKSISLLGTRFFEFLRMSACIPRVGSEIRGSEILLETGFEAAVSRNKGCYPGQEVIERIFTYGQVNKKLLRVSLELNGQSPNVPFPLLEDGKGVGEVVSWEKDPFNENLGIGLAYMHRSQWESKKVFRTPFRALQGTIASK